MWLYHVLDGFLLRRSLAFLATHFILTCQYGRQVTVQCFSRQVKTTLSLKGQLIVTRPRVSTLLTILVRIKERSTTLYIYVNC